MFCHPPLSSFRPLCSTLLCLFKPLLPPQWLLLGSPTLIDHQLSQHNAGLHHSVQWLQQEVTRLKARFKPTSHEVYGGANWSVQTFIVKSMLQTKYLNNFEKIWYLRLIQTINRRKFSSFDQCNYRVLPHIIYFHKSSGKFLAGIYSMKINCVWQTHLLGFCRRMRLVWARI